MKQQIVIIHGGNTFASYQEYIADLKQKELQWERLMQIDWKERLAERLGDDYEVIRPKMPNAQNAKYAEWKIWWQKVESFVQDNVILIGHSLGGIFLAKYLAEEKMPITVKAVFLIAPPFRVGADESLADFEMPNDLSLLSQQCEQVSLYHSKDDPVVPFTNLAEYTSRLPQAKVRIFDDRQHFNQENLPELEEEVREVK